MSLRLSDKRVNAPDLLKVIGCFSLFVGSTMASAQGVPIFDQSRLAQTISRLAEGSRDAVAQGDKLALRDNLSNIEQEQIEAYERFLEQTTGTTDISGFETGGPDFPSASEAYPIEEEHPDQRRLFGDGASVEQMIIETARRYQNHPGVHAAGLNPLTWRILFQSLIKAESSFNNSVVSHVGARGFCQLMPGTARELGVNPYDPWENLDGGARYILAQLKRFGRVDHALAAYNAGPGNVMKYHGIPPFEETQTYVRRINRFYHEYLSIITGVDMEGSMIGVDGASAEWGNLADASMGYGAYMSSQIDMAMRRILGLLKRAEPQTAKEAVDHNTYMLAERARLMALTLRLRAAHVKVDAARGISDAAQNVQHTDFWEYENE